MCISPTTVHVPHLNKYKRIEAPCGYCWACLKNRQNDLVAKVLMEMTTSSWAFVVTLTYDDKKLPAGDTSAQRINKYHFKRLCAHLRKKSSFKYLAAGEYGKRNSRAHFHAAFMGCGPKPDILPLRTRAIWKPYWLHGFSYFDECDANSIDYIAKYLTKGRKQKTDEEPEKEWITYSKNPPLGTNFVLNLADQYAAERVMPRTFRINPPGSNLLNRKMQISGLQQNLFLERIYTQWPEAIYLKKTEWMENATLRWRKWQQNKNFETMTTESQINAIDDSLRLQTHKKELTPAEIAWQEYKQTEEYAEWLTWVRKADAMQDAKASNRDRSLDRSHPSQSGHATPAKSAARTKRSVR